MQKNIVKKGLVIAVICLFIGVSFQPIIAENTIAVEKESDYNNVDIEQAKEYLFQTLIDISNNSEVKEFLNVHKQNLITNDYDCKNAVQKILSQKPKLLKSILFTKPEMTYEYLETNYNKGLELYNILGEEETSKIAKSVKTNSELFNKLKNIIVNDKELSDKISNLEKINIDVKSNWKFWNFTIICGILYIIILPAMVGWDIIMYNLFMFFFSGEPQYLFTLLIMIPFIPLFILLEYIIVIPYYLFGCDFLDDYK